MSMCILSRHYNMLFIWICLCLIACQTKATDTEESSTTDEMNQNDTNEMVDQSTDTLADYGMYEMADHGMNDMSTMPDPDMSTMIDTAEIHITVALHLEPNESYGQCGPNGYDKIRTQLVHFVKEVVARGAALNIQSDNTFFEGVALCESEVDHTDTDGLELGAWIMMQANVEVDAHKEGGNERNPEGTGLDDTIYADVHALAEVAMPSVSQVVGGFIWQSDEQVTQLLSADGLTGVLPDTPV